jgi:cellobiose phosphorylase
LHISPCLPPDWQAFRVHYRYRDSLYHIDVRQAPAADAGMKVSVDGVAQSDATIRLVDDHQEHYVEVNLKPRTVIRQHA